jgi:hypothetical protein
MNLTVETGVDPEEFRGVDFATVFEGTAERRTPDATCACSESSVSIRRTSGSVRDGL